VISTTYSVLVLVLTILKDSAYLTEMSIYHKALILFNFDREITGTNQY